MKPNMLGIDSADTEQYFATFQRSAYLEPEKELLRAILEDAIHCYRKYRAAKDRTGRERFREAEEWIMGGGDDWIFSFVNVCELLALDPQFVRRALRKSNQRTEPEKSQSRSGSQSQAA